MRHVTRVTVARADAKQLDGGGAVFFQIWLSVFTTILAGAFGLKG